MPLKIKNWTTVAGIAGLGVACGPVAPQDSGETGTDATSAGPGPSEGSSEPTSAGPDPSTPTTSMTTSPPPECEDDGDCSDVYCGYCSDGVCVESPGCCGVRGLHPRCSPPYECYDDEGCAPDEVCEGGLCVPIQLPQLRPCEDLPALVQQWSLEVEPWAFALADLDGDGDLDLAAAQPSVARVEIRLNDGLGGFEPGPTIALGGPTDALALAAGDLDEDGDNDLAVVRGDPGGGLVLLFGQDAVFTPAASLPTAPSPSAVLIAELEDDELEDIVTISPTVVTTRRGMPGGDFSVEVESIDMDSVDPRASLFDFDGNGRLDLVGPILGSTATGIWLGDASGGFVPSVSIDGGLVDAAVQLGDLDLQPVEPFDDLPALVFGRTVDGAGQIDVWPVINAPQMFGAPINYFTSLPIAGGVLAAGFAAGPSLLAATGQSTVLVAEGDGVGGFKCERLLAVEAPSEQRLLAAGDLNGDGRADVVAGAVGTPGVTTILSQ